MSTIDPHMLPTLALKYGRLPQYPDGLTRRSRQPRDCVSVGMSSVIGAGCLSFIVGLLGLLHLHESAPTRLSGLQVIFSTSVFVEFVEGHVGVSCPASDAADSSSQPNKAVQRTLGSRLSFR